MKRFWDVLEGTHNLSRASRLETTEVAVHAWIMALVETEFSTISKFLDSLARRKGLKPNTVKAYLTSSYIPFFMWYRLFSLVMPQPSPEAYARLHIIMKSLVANYRKKAKVTKRVDTKTVEELIANKQWPAGGLAELQDAYMAQLPHILCAFDEGVESYRHHDDFFRSFMALMMFGFYVFAPQGRPGGINELSLADGGELLEYRKLYIPLLPLTCSHHDYFLGFFRVRDVVILQNCWVNRAAARDARHTAGRTILQVFGDSPAGHCAEGRGPGHSASLSYGNKGERQGGA